MSIKDVFDKYATDYDAARYRLIPCFEDFYQTAIERIPFDQDQAFQVLDLGAGTGRIAELIAAEYFQAKIHLMDIAEHMLSQAPPKLASYTNDFSFILADYTKAEAFTTTYDVIISSLSIHHLSGAEKQELFQTLYTHLNHGGIFINADQVLGETPEIEKTYRQKWIEQVKARGTTEAQLHAALERMEEDQMSPLSAQIQWLKEAGFSNVNCWYKHYSFTVFTGTK